MIWLIEQVSILQTLDERIHLVEVLPWGFAGKRTVGFLQQQRSLVQHGLVLVLPDDVDDPVHPILDQASADHGNNEDKVIGEDGPAQVSKELEGDHG